MPPFVLQLLFTGTFVTCSAKDRSLSIHSDFLLAVDVLGFIRHFEAASNFHSKELALLAEQGGHSYRWDCSSGEVEQHTMGPDSSFILPGFVDTHLHAPQYMNAGTALDNPLMEWLEHYTLRAEARIDQDAAGLGKKVYTKLVERLIEAGTTAASVFGTISIEANLFLARAFLEAGIRGHIGKVSMDLNGVPGYIETTVDSLGDNIIFIDRMEDMVDFLPPHLRLVEPIITPRFVPTCSEKLLRGLVALAKRRGNVEVFDSLELLGPTSLMAHCTHATPPVLSLLAERGTSIAHCPLSNVYFSPERPLPLREAWDAGCKVGIGSDVSGGYRVGIDESMRWAVGVSRIRAGAQEEGTKEATRPITWKEAIFLATLGGAQALGLDDRVGSFEVGKSFDAQWIRFGEQGSRLDFFEATPVVEQLEKWWCNGSEADRVGVWVQGRCLRMRF